LKGQVIPAMTIEGRKHNPGIIRVLCVNLEGSIAGAEQSLLLLVRFASKTVQIPLIPLMPVDYLDSLAFFT
jgi:hypothetical protein